MHKNSLEKRKILIADWLKISLKNNKENWFPAKKIKGLWLFFFLQSWL